MCSLASPCFLSIWRRISIADKSRTSLFVGYVILYFNVLLALKSTWVRGSVVMLVVKRSAGVAHQGESVEPNPCRQSSMRIRESMHLAFESEAETYQYLSLWNESNNLLLTQIKVNNKYTRPRCGPAVNSSGYQGCCKRTLMNFFLQSMYVH